MTSKICVHFTELSDDIISVYINEIGLIIMDIDDISPNEKIYICSDINLLDSCESYDKIKELLNGHPFTYKSYFIDKSSEYYSSSPRTPKSSKPVITSKTFNNK